MSMFFGGKMIQPIFSSKINQTYKYNMNFKGFYDPSCVSIPPSMKEEIANATKKKIASVKPEKFLPDSNNIVHEQLGTVSHILPDGTLINLDLESLKSSTKQLLEGSLEYTDMGAVVLKKFNMENFLKNTLPDEITTIDPEVNEIEHFDGIEAKTPMHTSIEDFLNGSDGEQDIISDTLESLGD